MLLCLPWFETWKSAMGVTVMLAQGRERCCSCHWEEIVNLSLAPAFCSPWSHCNEQMNMPFQGYQCLHWLLCIDAPLLFYGECDPPYYSWFRGRIYVLKKEWIRLTPLNAFRYLVFDVSVHRLQPRQCFRWTRNLGRLDYILVLAFSNRLGRYVKILWNRRV